MMTFDSALSTAFVRGLYSALLAFAGTFLTTFSATDETKASLIAAGTAAVIALGWRAGAEGTFDERRNTVGKVSSGDVGQPDKVVR